jgi:hypothetical protein
MLESSSVVYRPENRLLISKEAVMLILSRRIGEQLLIGGDILVDVLETSGIYEQR